MAWSELCSGKHTGAVVHSVCCGETGGAGRSTGRKFRSFGPEREQSCGGEHQGCREQVCSPSPFPVFTLSSQALIFAFLSLGFMKFNFQGVSEYPMHLIMFRR